MAVTVTFYTFSKNPHSTARPSGGRDFECEIIAPSSVITPQILLSLGGGNPSGYNFAYIADFNRYYWVTDWTYDKGLWTASLSVDVLATYRDEIGSSSQYILRAASERNGYVIDSFYPTTAKWTTITTQAASAPFFKDLPNGEYILGVIGQGGVQMGAVSYYGMSPPAFQAFSEYLFSDQIFDKIGKEQTIWGFDDQGKLITKTVDRDINVVKTQFNPAEYIVSCMWLPFVPTESPAASSIRLGWWDIPAGAVGVGSTWEKVLPIAVPAHPQQPQRGYYLHSNPYSRFTLICPPFGQIPLDGSYFVEAANLNLRFTVDTLSGMGALSVETPSGAVIHRQTAQIGVPISVGQMLNNSLNMGIGVVGSLVGTVAAGFTGNIGGATTAAVTGITTALDTPLAQTTISGSNGSRAEFGIVPKLISQFATVTDEDHERYGSPVCGIRTINSLNGFIMCGHPEIELAATSAETEKVKSYMRGGFYFV